MNRLLSQLENVKQTGSDKWQALCPAHGDKDPSLSISFKDGKILLNCFAGCGYKNILAAVGLEPKDLFLENATMKRDLVKTYDYCDEKGKLLFQACRYEPKDFRQRRPDGKGGWIYNLKGIRRVLYKLPEILLHDRIFIVEGEKDADALWGIGLAATTCPMGAGKWKSEYNESLRNKDVILIPDSDDQGRKHMDEVALGLKGHAKSISIINLPSGKDVYDWLENLSDSLYPNELLEEWTEDWQEKTHIKEVNVCQKKPRQKPTQISRGSLKRFSS